ncbi:hypothetical protein NPIL_338521 [Nephila pilipes]|uniref:Uncharacterized protein n=1 Tax=Nephila pilipes TaxID=299642 RepID=A0A8X6IL87_NEPPI|nr:hypothetical protein NPIL_338521 [Nephila pilipes]
MNWCRPLFYSKLQRNLGVESREAVRISASTTQLYHRSERHQRRRPALDSDLTNTNFITEFSETVHEIYNVIFNSPHTFDQNLGTHFAQGVPPPNTAQVLLTIAPIPIARNGRVKLRNRKR